VLRYVERNALRANLVDQAQDWRWCSLWRKLNGDRESLLSAWPLDRPENWVDWVNGAQTDAEIEALRRCVNRGTPYGSENWKTQIAAALGLKYTLQPRGRPTKVMGLTNTQTYKKVRVPFSLSPLSSQTMLFYDTLQCQINNLPLVRAGAVASNYTDQQKWTHTRHLNLSVIS